MTVHQKLADMLCKDIASLQTPLVAIAANLVAKVRAHVQTRDILTWLEHYPASRRSVVVGTKAGARITEISSPCFAGKEVVAGYPVTRIRCGKTEYHLLRVPTVALKDVKARKKLATSINETLPSFKQQS